MTYMVVVERFFKEMHWLKWKKKRILKEGTQKNLGELFAKTLADF